MSTEEDEGKADGKATVAERKPRVDTAKPAVEGDEKATLADKRKPASSEPTAILPKTASIAPSAPGASTGSSAPSSPSDGLTMTTPAEALHREEVRRIRQFIVLGWLTSLAAVGVVPLVDVPRWMDIAFVAALAWGVIISAYFFRRFGRPGGYDGRQMVIMGVFVAINAHVVIGYFGAFSAGPMISVLGIHFIARGEAIRAMRGLYLVCLACYVIVASVIVVGLVPDPGVFASEEPHSRVTLAAGMAFVVGIYMLAYHTGRVMRRASIKSIEGLQRQTRLAAQRKALLDELRADLERALRVGGPGRHTGQVLGDFKLGDVIGRGAMGEVYEARREKTDEPAAVKVLRRELLADSTQVTRFMREVTASRRIESPHVVRMLDAAAEGVAVPYLAMERLQGQTLAEMLRRESKLAAADVVELCRHAGAGIDAAAAAGIVHRDLKPQNLFRATRAGGADEWKILDFGVASLVDDSGTLTQGGVVGTPGYMAPEQAKGGRVDSRADVFSLAAVAYRSLTGRAPFNAPDTPAVLYAVVHRMPPRPSEHAAFHVDVDRWVALALAKDPDERLRSGRELADTLVSALDGALDAKLRKRADAAIKKYGWGGDAKEVSA